MIWWQRKTTEWNSVRTPTLSICRRWNFVEVQSQSDKLYKYILYLFSYEMSVCSGMWFYNAFPYLWLLRRLLDFCFRVRHNDNKKDTRDNLAKVRLIFSSNEKNFLRTTRIKQMPRPEFSEVLSTQNFTITCETFHLLFVSLWHTEFQVFTMLAKVPNRFQTLPIWVVYLTLFLSVSLIYKYSVVWDRIIKQVQSVTNICSLRKSTGAHSEKKIETCQQHSCLK